MEMCVENTCLDIVTVTKVYNMNFISGVLLSMSPVTESAYENAAFTGETSKKGKNKVN